MNRTAQFRRLAVALSLILSAALSILWVVLQPPAPTSSAEGLGNMSAHMTTATLAAFAFTVSQVPFVLAALGISHVISRRAPVLAALGAGFALLGGFGHAILGGAQLVQLGMAADAAHHDVYSGLLDGGMPWALNVFMLAGTLGTVLGLILLAAGLLRAKAGPPWVSYALWAFVLVEFAGSNFTTWASVASGLLYLSSFVALAGTVWGTPLSLWIGEEGVVGEEKAEAVSPAATHSPEG